jgi:hypothetical protein
MSELLARRLAALGGLVLTMAVALWWLGSSRLALDRGSDASRAAVDALHALWLVRGMALALLGPRGGPSGGWRNGIAATLPLVAPAWPLVVVAWSASTISLTQVAVMESLLLAAGIALPLLGRVLRRALRQGDLADAAATCVGVALAASWWLTRDIWMLPAG